MHEKLIGSLILVVFAARDQNKKMFPSNVIRQGNWFAMNKKLSVSELTWKQAQECCFDSKLGDYDDGRLPRRSELETMINPDLVDKKVSSVEQPFQSPFVAQMDGYIFSG